MRFIDLTGQRFGRLLVLDRATNDAQGRARWRCACDCGNEAVITRHHLRDGRTKSCGCLRRDVASELNHTHGFASKGGVKPTYRIYRSMLSRTTNPRDASWKNYGGRGITVCDRWNPARGGSFENFLADVGERPADNLSLDRIDNDRGYEPRNVRWATATEQARNRRSFSTHRCDQTYPTITYVVGPPTLLLVAA